MDETSTAYPIQIHMMLPGLIYTTPLANFLNPFFLHWDWNCFLLWEGNPLFAWESHRNHATISVPCITTNLPAAYLQYLDCSFSLVVMYPIQSRQQFCPVILLNRMFLLGHKGCIQLWSHRTSHAPALCRSHLKSFSSFFPPSHCCVSLGCQCTH